MTQAASYSAAHVSVDGFDVVRLTQETGNFEVSVVPAIGNNAYSFKVNGVEVLWSPYSSLTDFKAKPVLLGVPFLAPWANRLDGDSYFANGKKYRLNPDLGNFRYDEHRLPIHGLLSNASQWEVASAHADAQGAEVTSRLEFWKFPDYMEQFPFAQSIEMTYRLSKGILEVRTAITNLSKEPLPLSIGFHPYYRISDAPRDSWTVHIPAREHYMLSAQTLPTGKTERTAFAPEMSLASQRLDDVFGEVDHNDVFSVQGKRQRIAVRFGPKYAVAVVYAPPGRDFICFEPMSGITDAFNLAHSGVYHDLQTVAPGGQWIESFFIQPTGF